MAKVPAGENICDLCHERRQGYEIFTAGVVGSSGELIVTERMCVFCIGLRAGPFRGHATGVNREIEQVGQ